MEGKMASIFIGIPSYADPDLPHTIESAVRNQSGLHELHFGICEQVTRYLSAYRLGLVLPDNVRLHVGHVGDKLIGLGGARHLVERHYRGEEYQVQLDAHIRFDANWDDTVVSILRQP